MNRRQFLKTFSITVATVGLSSLLPTSMMAADHTPNLGTQTIVLDNWAEQFDPMSDAYGKGWDV